MLYVVVVYFFCILSSSVRVGFVAFVHAIAALHKGTLKVLKIEMQEYVSAAERNKQNSKTWANTWIYHEIKNESERASEIELHSTVMKWG